MIKLNTLILSLIGSLAVAQDTEEPILGDISWGEIEPSGMTFNRVNDPAIHEIGTVVVSPQTKVNESSYVIQDSILIPTKHESGISATIVRKKNNHDPLPVVLFYTTYSMGESDVFFGKISADRDYVGVVAYARGIRTNLGEYMPFEHEATDLYEVIDWISKQPWCNGKVGMFGGSYTGFSQWAIAKQNHPALKTIVPQVAVMPGFDMPMENNVPYGNILGWANDNIYKNASYNRGLVFDWFAQGKAFESLDTLGGQPNPIFQSWLKHPSYDEYWQSLVPTAEEYAKIKIPILTTTGYYDGSQIGALEYFKQHTVNSPGADHYLVIGPYDHWGGQGSVQKSVLGYVTDSVAHIGMRELAFQWLDYILKDSVKPAILQDKVNFQVMGTNAWRHAPSLESINNDTLKFYLADHHLVQEEQNINHFSKQRVNFKDRKTQNNFYVPQLEFDSLDPSNGLVYSTQPFENEFTINGSFSGDLIAEINKADMDISIGLFERMQDGSYFFLTRYVGRASYAHDNTTRNLLNSKERSSVPINNTRFISKKIGKGSQLVLLVNVNKHPFEIINYGSGKEVAKETIADAKKPLRIKWFANSFIEIPIVHE